MASPVITIFVRHAADCKYHGDEFSKRCDCKKHLRWSYGGRQFRQTAHARSWAQAEDSKRKVEAQFQLADDPAKLEKIVTRDDAKTIADAVRLFLADKAVQGIDSTAQKKHERELLRLAEFLGRRGRIFPHEIRLEDLIEFRTGWTEMYPSSVTRAKVQERLRGFLRHLRDTKLIDDVPKLSPIKVDATPTMPLNERQYRALLEAIPKEFTGAKAIRVRALVQLMRHSGLAIQDAVTLKPGELHTGNVARVVTSRQKTGTHVSVPIPPDVAKEVIAAMPLNGNPEYIFWNRIDGEAKAAVDVWERAFRRIFRRAKLPGGHSHQLRDSFAVALLQKGVPMEEVSKALGHRSIKTTEKSYAPWVKGRQDRLDSLITGTWAAALPG